MPKRNFEPDGVQHEKLKRDIHNVLEVNFNKKFYTEFNLTNNEYFRVCLFIVT